MSIAFRRNPSKSYGPQDDVTCKKVFLWFFHYCTGSPSWFGHLAYSPHPSTGRFAPVDTLFRVCCINQFLQFLFQKSSKFVYTLHTDTVWSVDVIVHGWWVNQPAKEQSGVGQNDQGVNEPVGQMNQVVNYPGVNESGQSGERAMNPYKDDICLYCDVCRMVAEWCEKVHLLRNLYLLLEFLDICISITMLSRGEFLSDAWQMTCKLHRQLKFWLIVSLFA